MTDLTQPPDKGTPKFEELLTTFVQSMHLGVMAIMDRQPTEANARLDDAVTAKASVLAYVAAKDAELAGSKQANAEAGKELYAMRRQLSEKDAEIERLTKERDAAVERLDEIGQDAMGRE